MRAKHYNSFLSFKMKRDLITETQKHLTMIYIRNDNRRELAEFEHKFIWVHSSVQEVKVYRRNILLAEPDGT